jgi:hypothetical protein
MFTPLCILYSETVACEMILSIKDIAQSQNPSSPAAHLLSRRLTFFRRWFPSLKHFSSLNEPDYQHDDGDDEQDMNNSTHGVAAYQSQEP